MTANLKGFSVGNGIWGLGDWTSSFTRRRQARLDHQQPHAHDAGLQQRQVDCDLAGEPRQGRVPDHPGHADRSLQDAGRGHEVLPDVPHAGCVHPRRLRSTTTTRCTTTRPSRRAATSSMRPRGRSAPRVAPTCRTVASTSAPRAPCSTTTSAFPGDVVQISNTGVQRLVLRRRGRLAAPLRAVLEHGRPRCRCGRVPVGLSSLAGQDLLTAARA